MSTEENHLSFLKQAIRLSQDNVTSGAGGPFGAIIVKDGVVIGQGSNQVTTSHDPTAHAEIVAIRQACSVLQTFSLHGCIVYTSCEPCPMCLAAAYWARVDTVYFAATQADAADAGFDDAFLYHELTLPRSERSLPVNAVVEARDAARNTFALWMQDADKVRY